MANLPNTNGADRSNVHPLVFVPPQPPVPFGRGFDFWGDAEPSVGLNLNVSEYIRLLLKHRLTIIGVVILALAAGAGVTLLSRPQYTASTTLQIDREAAKVVNDNMTTNESLIQGDEFYQTQYGLLKNEALASRVMDSLNLANSNDFLKSMGVHSKPKSKSGVGDVQASRIHRDQVLQVLRSHLKVDPVRGSRLVNLSFSSPDPTLSATIVNAFADNFIQSNLDRRFESSSYARDFLEHRIAQVKAKLEDAERQLVAYASNQQIINVAGTNGVTQSLAAGNLAGLNTDLAAAKAETAKAAALWQRTKSTPTMMVPEVLSSLTIQDLVQARAKAEADYQQKLRTFKPGFPEMVQAKAQISELNQQIDAEARNIIGSIKTQYEVAVAQQSALQHQVDLLKASDISFLNRNIQYTILQREVDTSRALYDGLLQRYKEISAAGGATVNNISVVNRADPPIRPSSPKPLLNMALALVLGLGLGMLTALLREALDESLSAPDDLEAKLGISALGVVPVLEKGVTPARALADIRSPFAEAYYSLRTALQFSTADGFPETLLVTSARPSEGKSTTALALAQGMARVGRKVLVVDADLRNPSIHREVGLDNDVGLSNILAGAASLSEALQTTEALNLSFVTCGPLPPNPAELLGGPRLGEFLREARAAFEIVIIDGPPVLGFADAPLLAAQVSGVTFVVQSRATRRGQARDALRRLRVGNGNVLGAVLTKFSLKSAGYGAGYDYAYSYDYGLTQQNRITQKKASA